MIQANVAASHMLSKSGPASASRYRGAQSTGSSGSSSADASPGLRPVSSSDLREPHPLPSLEYATPCHDVALSRLGVMAYVENIEALGIAFLDILADFPQV